MYAALAYLKLMGGRTQESHPLPPHERCWLVRSSARWLVIAHELLSALKSAQKTEGFD
jgi:hypothetical protein